MDDQGSKKIIFNKSTLFNLKAELLKKQEEVKCKKHLPEHNVENFRPAPVKTDKEEISDKKTLKDIQPVDVDERESFRKAKLILEEKAKIYEHLSDSAGNSKLSSRFLVDFNAKKQNEERDIPNEEPLLEPEEFKDVKEDYGDDSEWTEFTDCLGRTRTCLKSDVELYLKQDAKLAEVMYGDKEDSENINTEQNENKKPFLVEKTNDYLMSLREKWEEKERELLAKDRDIHYQDLLFDEARQHGVGYYSFSTDESERRKQMEALQRSREDSLKAQREGEAARAQREDALEARAKAARARLRARAGLPPEQPKENADEFNARLLELLNKQRKAAEAEAEAQENRKREELEKERQKIREAFVREWDIGKDGVQSKLNKFRELSQEEYVEQQRDKRIGEFAPPQATNTYTSYNWRNPDLTYSNKGKRVETVTSQSLLNKTWEDVRPKQDEPTVNYEEEHHEGGLYFSSNNKSQNKPKRDLIYKNFMKTEEQVPVPIVNELEDVGDCERPRPDKRRYGYAHIEIEPPPTYEYYGPEAKHTKPEKPLAPDMHEAYAQGAKNLESKKQDLHLSKAYDFTFD